MVTERSLDILLGAHRREGNCLVAVSSRPACLYMPVISHPLIHDSGACMRASLREEVLQETKQLSESISLILFHERPWWHWQTIYDGGRKWSRLRADLPSDSTQKYWSRVAVGLAVFVFCSCMLSARGCFSAYTVHRIPFSWRGDVRGCILLAHERGVLRKMVICTSECMPRGHLDVFAFTMKPFRRVLHYRVLVDDWPKGQTEAESGSHLWSHDGLSILPACSVV